MSLGGTEKGGVALHFFESDRSRRYYIDALPWSLGFRFQPCAPIVRGEIPWVIAYPLSWYGIRGAKTSGSRPRGFWGGLVHLVQVKTLKSKNSSFEERRERPRPVAWPKTPPGQYQPSPMFGFTPKRGVKKSQTGECFCEVLPYRPLNGPKGAILSGIWGGKPRIGAEEVF